jgi:hypothetical protein
LQVNDSDLQTVLPLVVDAVQSTAATAPAAAVELLCWATKSVSMRPALPIAVDQAGPAVVGMWQDVLVDEFLMLLLPPPSSQSSSSSSLLATCCARRISVLLSAPTAASAPLWPGSRGYWALLWQQKLFVRLFAPLQATLHQQQAQSPATFSPASLAVVLVACANVVCSLSGGALLAANVAVFVDCLALQLSFLNRLETARVSVVAVEGPVIAAVNILLRLGQAAAVLFEPHLHLLIPRLVKV